MAIYLNLCRKNVVVCKDSFVIPTILTLLIPRGDKYSSGTKSLPINCMVGDSIPDDLLMI